MPNVIHLKLTPSDVLMFREARPFDQVATASDSVFPSPRTIAGALRTWLLEGVGQDIGGVAATLQNEKLSEITKKALEDHCRAENHWILDACIRGPFMVRGQERLFPLPLHLVYNTKGKSTSLERLSPVLENLPGYVRPKEGKSTSLERLSPVLKNLRGDDFRHLLLRGGDDWENKTEVFLPVGAMRNALAKDATVTLWDLEPSQAKREDALWRTERRYGIAVEGDTRAVEEGALYASEFMRLEYDVSFDVDIACENPESIDRLRHVAKSNPWLKLGGEGKTAWVEEITDDRNWPAAPTTWEKAQRFFTCLVTPGRFKDGNWFPTEMSGRFKLISAFVGAPLVFSGWDALLNRPLKTRYAARMGSVYFWEKKDNCEESDPHGESISDDENDKQAGWGISLRGEWDYVD